MGRGQGEPAIRNTMRTKRKRILCTTNTLNLLQEHEILNFISVLAGTTLMTINYSVANYQAVGLALVWFVFVLALDLGHGQALKGEHTIHANSSKRIHFSGFKSSNLEFGINTTSMHSLCILKHRENLAPYDRPTNKEHRRALINNAVRIANANTKTRFEW